MTGLLIKCLIVCPLVFIAGFVDAIAGGGGTITLPAYMMAGLPAHMAIGTNKTVASIGMIPTVYKYVKSGKVLGDVSVLASVGSILGAVVGSKLGLNLSDQALKTVLLVALPCVALFLSFNRGFGQENNIAKDHTRAKRRFLSLLIGLGIGAYDGLVGPGTGTFFVIAFTAVLGTDLLTSSACGRVANIFSNISSMVIYVSAGQLDYLITLPAALSYGVGGYAGTCYALKGGSKKVREVMFIVLGMLFAKMIADMLGMGF